MITKQQKKEIIQDLADKLSQHKGVVFFDYTGLKVGEFEELRSKLREAEIECRVVRKTLIDLAIQKAGLTADSIKAMPGQIAIVIGYQDEIIPAKILYEFAKEKENSEIVAGIIQNDYLGKEAIISLAQLPSKQELLVKLLGSISSPLYGLTNTLQGNLNKLVYILTNLKQKA